MTAVLRVPLVAKLVGANALIVVAALLSLRAVHSTAAASRPELLVLVAALAGSVVANVALVALALRPLADLEATAQRVHAGNLDVRVPGSLFAGGDLQRVGGALNAVLDGLSADRARLRELTARVISAGDEERSHLARELHDSTAQSLTALLLELSVVTREVHDPATLERLERVRHIVTNVLDEIRMLSQTVHPRVLDDLGLGAALQHLARETEARGTLRVEVVVEDSAAVIDAATGSMLYRVAQEALANAIRHSNATVIFLRAAVREGVARVEVSDDGIGFRQDEAARRRPGMGLFTMRERMSLVRGALEVDSAPGRGTRVVASVPLTAPVTAMAASDVSGT